MCGAIILVFIFCLVIVGCSIRRNGRKKWQHPAFDSQNSRQQAADNTYDSRVAPRSPLYDDVNTEDENEAYAEVPETRPPERNNVFYHTVHRPESSTSDPRASDEVQYGNIGQQLSNGAIYEDANDMYSTNNTGEILYSTGGSPSADSVTKPKKVSQSSSVGSVENAIYEKTRSSFQNSFAKPNGVLSPKQSCSSIGSIDNPIYETGSLCRHGSKSSDVFSPAPSVTSFEGTIVNVIYETAAE